MSERNGPSAEERERVDRYLAWRQGHPRIRTARRRRLWARGALATLLGLALIVFFAWLSTSRDPRRISVVEPEPPRAAPRVVPDGPERPVAPKSTPRPPRPAVAAPAPQLPPRPKASPRPKAPPQAFPGQTRVTEAERPTAAPVESPPISPPLESSDASPASRGPALPPGSASSSDHAQVAATEPPPPPAPPPVTTEPPPVTIQPPPAEPAPGQVVEPTPGEPAARTPCEVARRPRTAAGERRGPAVVDCVGGWLQGEADEFRDGVKRGIGEFRTGFDRLRREIRELGEKLSR